MDAPVVLIVEDEPDIRRALMELLEDAGYVTLTAATGPEGVDLSAEEPAVAIVDVRLPGGFSGYEVVHQLRERFGERLGIVVLSGVRTQPSDRATALHLGADDYMTKPYDAEELLARVERLASDKLSRR